MTRRPSRRLAAVADRLDGGDDALWLPPFGCRSDMADHSCHTGCRLVLGDPTVTRAPIGPTSQRRGSTTPSKENNVTSLICTSSGSRAVERAIAPGSEVRCAHCGALVRFAARQRDHQVIANVYVDGRWARVEHFHPRCYSAAADPYGPAEMSCLPSRSKAIGVGGRKG
jgi:hypothetical protein